MTVGETRVETEAAGRDALSFSLSGGLGASSSLALDRARGVLRYRYEPRGGGRAETATIRPSAAQWKRFWARMEGLGVWEWERSYRRRQPPPDAVSWELELAHEGRRVRASGFGEGPTTLTDAVEALSALAGGRDL